MCETRPWREARCSMAACAVWSDAGALVGAGLKGDG